ncbi:MULTISPECIES: hypothetical protein [Paenibacillus]|uniref:hypothetical protein n=1 Tax=Paenibacillus TaxID=44249 RepID=UPI0015C32EAE|nr:hypothetical protein [Paenibacillus odorifer]
MASVTVNFMNLKPIKQATEIICMIIEDERISVDVRDEYATLLNAIDWEKEL